MTTALVLFFVASALLGYRIITAVPSLLHTPLMSGMNALSGITLIGAIALYATAPPEASLWLIAALLLSTINIAGGFWVTERMLKMFKGNKQENGDKAPWQ
jgi:NAD(P) transhydrogenase subunit alpha